MKMRTDRLIILLLTSLILGACSSDDSVDGGGAGNSKKIELSFSVPGYTMNVTDGRNTSETSATRATTVTGSSAENEITDLYVFLFPTSTDQTLKKYAVSSASFTGGTWSTSDNKVDLDLTQAEAGQRDVYIVANCADLKSQLDEVTTVEGLQNVLRNTAMPWSDNIQAPILMTGNATHDFIQDSQLDQISLTRAIAKIELNVTLSSPFQTVPTITDGKLDQYKYRFVNFDQNTYVIKPSEKTATFASSSDNAWPNTDDWSLWGASLNGSSTSDTGTGYTLSTTGGVVTALKIITYINESDVSGSAIEIELPRTDEGPLPPPEFGPEWYKLPLPDKIVRNTWYTYNIDL
jgi:hypothetical protein